MFQEIRSALIRFKLDSSANIALITALCIIPLVGIMGVAIDFSLALNTKSKLDAAIDAAVVTASMSAKTAFNGGSTVDFAIQQGQNQGLAAFRANAGNLSFVKTLAPNITIVQKGQNLVTTGSYTLKNENQFGGLFSIGSTNNGGSASSTAVLTPYYQFIFLVDISGSMAIGGTPSDIAGMQSDPNIQCAVACHDPNHRRLTTDPRAFAKADGWKLKIDYVNQAIQTFIQQLNVQTAGVSGVYSVGINTFATYFNVLQSPTTNFSLAKSQAATIDIEPMDYLNISQGYTRTTTSLLAAFNQLSNIGDGSSPNQQKTYIIFLSDGVEDIEGNMVYGRGTDVTYTTACDAIKSAGVQIFSIYATYPVVNDGQYPILVAPLASKLAPAMTNCASSPTMAFQASDGPSINAAVQNTLQQILQGMTRLTQ